MNKTILYSVISLLIVIGGFFIYKNLYVSQTSGNKNLAIEKKRTLDFNKPICEQITASQVEEILGKKIVDMKSITNSTSNICEYYIDETNFVTLRLNLLNFDTQKKGQELFKRKITTDSQISMEHFVAIQEDGLINDIVLKINNNMFIAIDRSSNKAANEEEIKKFAINISQIIESGNFEKKTENITKDVPLPQSKNIIYKLYQLIEERRIDSAVSLLSNKNIEDESSKQAWGVQFNAIKSVKIKTVEPIMEDSWTDKQEEYEVVLDMSMDTNSANAPIPYYGYENGENIRFITLIMEDDLWRIDQIATGP